MGEAGDQLKSNEERFSKYFNKSIFIKLLDGFIYKGILTYIGADFLEVDDVKDGPTQINPKEIMVIKPWYDEGDKGGR